VLQRANSDTSLERRDAECRFGRELQSGPAVDASPRHLLRRGNARVAADTAARDESQKDAAGSGALLLSHPKQPPESRPADCCSRRRGAVQAASVHHTSRAAPLRLKQSPRGGDSSPSRAVVPSRRTTSLIRLASRLPRRSTARSSNSSGATQDLPTHSARSGCRIGGQQGSRDLFSNGGGAGR